MTAGSKFAKLTCISVAVLMLGGCGNSAPAVRPATQNLQRLTTPEAQRRLAASKVALPQATKDDAQVCAQVLRASGQAGLILDRSKNDRLTVNSELWRRLPVQGQEVIVRCAELARPSGTTGKMAVVTASTR